MPNWCENTLKIIAKTDEARALLPQIEQRFMNPSDEQGSAFQLIKPMPAELEGTSAPSDSPNWYDWRRVNWGSKWSEHEPYVMDRTDSSLTVSFQTAWAPPEGIYQALLDKGFEVFATYAECGMGFAGWWHNGEDEAVEFQLTEEDWENAAEDIFARVFEGTPVTPDLYPAGFGG